MKKSIIIHEDTTELFRGLGDAEAGQLLKALLAYQNGEEVNIDSPVLMAVFSMLKAKLDKDNADYEAKCQKNAENVRKRWNKENTEEYERIPTNTDENERIRTDTQKDNNRITTGYKNKESKRFTPPTPEEVRDYCVEKGHKVDADAFVDFYAAKGWKVGNQPMKDWKAAVRNWARRESAAPPGKIRQYNNRYNDFPQRDTDYKKLQKDWNRREYGGYHNRYNDFPQRDNDYQQIQDDWIRAQFGK